MPVFVPSTAVPTHPGRFRTTVPVAGVPVAGVPFLTDVFGAAARVLVEAAFGADLHADPTGWDWTDITGDVRQADGQRVDVSPMGRSDETSTAQPAGCVFQLDNTTGDYTAYTARSRWWPYVRRNTPIRVTVNLTGVHADDVVRFQGYATGWVPSWDVSANLAVVTVSASGVLRRLAQGKTPLRAPLYRGITAVGPVACWALDDGRDATQAASVLVGGSPLQLVAAPSLAAVDGPPGAQQRFPEFVASNAYIGAVTAPLVVADTGAWTVEGWFKAESAPGVEADVVVATWRTTGTYGAREWTIRASRNAGPGLEFINMEADHSALSSTFFSGGPFAAGAVFGSWHQFRVTAHQDNPTTITVKYFVDGVQEDQTTAATWTIGRPVEITASGYHNPITDVTNPITAIDSLSLAYPAVYATDTPASTYTSGIGYTGETATARLARLCAEQGVPIVITGTSDTTMGAQPSDTFLNVLRECETTDHGVLYDGRGPGLNYVTRAARYNIPASLTADMAADPPQVADPFSPADDDQRNRNLVKADRRNGSSATFEQVDGPLGTDAVDTYDTSTTLNLSSDTGLVQHAAWLAHLGTVEGFRYPQLRLDLAAVPALAQAWLACQVSARVDVVNAASRAVQHPPGDVRLLLEGWSESLSPFDWQVAGNCSPYGPYQVGVLDGAFFLDCGGTTLDEALTLTETLIDVRVTDECVWTHADGDYLVTIGGEDILVRNVSAVTGAYPLRFQTLTTTRSVNGVVKTHAIGEPVHVADPLVLAL